MRKSVVKALALAMTASMALSLGACSKSGDSQKTGDSGSKVTKLRIYVDYADEDTKAPYDYAVAALKKEMPNVELDMEASARDDGAKLKTYAASGNLPDIFQANVDQINSFKKSNNILVLDQYASDFKSKLQNNSDKLLYHSDGHIYSFPFAGTEYFMMYYNKEIFEKNGVKVPTTYDELLAAVKTFKSKGIVPLSIFAKEKWPCVGLYDLIASRYDSAGVTKLDEGKAKASDEAYKTAAEKLEELVKAGLVPDGCTNLNYDQAAALFYEGKAAMFINGQWEIEASTKNLGDKVDWMTIPAKDAASVDSSKDAWCGSGSLGGFAVSPATKDKELAAKVASFLALKYAECKYTTRANPLVATKVTAPIQKQYPAMMKKLADEIPNIKSTTAFDWHLTNSKFKAGLEDNTQRLIAGGYSADAFVKDMDKVIEEAKQ